MRTLIRAKNVRISTGNAYLGKEKLLLQMLEKNLRQRSSEEKKKADKFNHAFNH